ncbi:MAG: hypothetical protein L6V95_02125 [Candidatus Melainabacteria bacterium]|nr:MAG: hypothetical protein L6V95_02125 [Candidatus Melainabacteria bacterium]
MGLGDPFISTAAIASGALLSQLSVTDNDLNYKYTKVTDADMIVLMRKIDELQKNLQKTILSIWELTTSSSLQIRLLNIETDVINALKS